MVAVDVLAALLPLVLLSRIRERKQSSETVMRRMEALPTSLYGRTSSHPRNHLTLWLIGASLPLSSLRLPKCSDPWSFASWPRRPRILK
jgi:hypothetical protein